MLHDIRISAGAVYIFPFYAFDEIPILIFLLPEINTHTFFFFGWGGGGGGGGRQATSTSPKFDLFFNIIIIVVFIIIVIIGNYVY